MKFSNENPNGPSRQAFITLIVLVLVIFLSLYSLIQKTQPYLTYTLGTLDQGFELAWYKDVGFASFVSNSDGVIFALPIGGEKLFAFDAKTGLTYWETDLSFEQSGMRVFLGDVSSVYIVSSINVNAYDAKTGNIRWSTKLGDGHVAIEAQLDGDLLKIYYGNRLYEIEPETGKILYIKPGVAHGDYPTFKIVNDEFLLTGSTSGGLCAQGAKTHKLLWCHPDIDLNLITIDEVCGLVYAMPDDNILQVINLFTGDVLGESTFTRSIPVDEKDDNRYVPVLFYGDGVVVVSFVDSGQTFGLKSDALCQTDTLSAP